MQKTLIAVIVLAVVGAGLFYILTSYTPNPESLEGLQDTSQTAEEVADEPDAGEVRGTIVSVNTEQAMVDGPVLVTVDAGTDGSVVIAVPSMGLPLCPAAANITDAFALTAGQQIVARGTVSADGMIVPCDAPDHYLQVVEPN